MLTILRVPPPKDSITPFGLPSGQATVGKAPAAGLNT